MNKSDWNHAVLNAIDPGLVEQAAAPAKKRAVRPTRIAIAACLCAVLAGGAFAAETIFGVPIFTPMDTNPATGEPFNGFTTIIELPGEAQQPDTAVNPLERPDVNGVFKLPVEAFSQQVRDAAAGLEERQHGQLDFDSLAGAEDFLGIELMDNPVLEAAGAACVTTVTAMDGILTSVMAESAYYLNYVDQPGASLHGGGLLSVSVPVRVDVTVQSYTEHSPIAAGDMFLGLGFPEEYTFTSETYTTPGGLTASIVAVSRPDETYGQVTDYYAQFALNGNAVTVSSVFIPDAGHALATLKQVLDAFE